MINCIHDGCTYKFVSGAQTGVDQGALDAAMALGLEHGGWCPKGRKSETGRIPDKYLVEECSSGGYPTRTVMNVKDTDVTALLHEGKFGPGANLTRRAAKRHHKGCIEIDIRDEPGACLALRPVFGNYEVVNFAGSRESSSPGVQKRVADLLEKCYREFAKDNHMAIPSDPDDPNAIAQAGMPWGEESD